MTLQGFINRLLMLPKVLDIAIRSLKTGIYVREAKFLKFSREFETIISSRDEQRGITVTEDESYTLFSSVLATNNLDGAIAEVGVYKGTTARLICEVKGNKTFYLFDTFQGMPNEKITNNDDWELNTHKDTSIESVSAYLTPYNNLIFVAGNFPESIYFYPDSATIKDQVYSFVNLDVDLYQSTLDALEFFYPRLVAGGRIVSHNYNLKDSAGGRTPGVKKAFQEYFSGCEHKIIEIAETQCLIIK